VLVGDKVWMEVKLRVGVQVVVEVKMVVVVIVRVSTNVFVVVGVPVLEGVEVLVGVQVCPLPSVHCVLVNVEVGMNVKVLVGSEEVGFGLVGFEGFLQDCPTANTINIASITIHF
jgi:hypothetical protein